MASASFRQKNATNSDSSIDIGRLLQSKVGLEPVTAGLKAAAEKLQRMGLISYRQCEYVRCAFTEDEDFRDSNRTCGGRLPINADLDENAGDYRCPECNRVIHPYSQQKRKFQEIRAKVLEDGVRAYIEKLLAEFGDSVRAVDGVPYVWRVDIGLAGVHVCLADFCDDQRVLSVQWAQQNPTCYVAVNPKALERFVKIDWLPKIMLAELVAGEVRLSEKIREIVVDDTRRDLPPLATPVYSKGAHRPEIVDSQKQTPSESFVLELGENTVRINGIDVLDTRAKTGLPILAELLRAFLQDLMAKNDSKEFLCQTPSDLADALQKTACKKEAIDADQIRRTINRLQDTFEERLCKAGFAAEHNSIIEASPDAAKEGYRLNPFKVAIRPLLS